MRNKYVDGMEKRSAFGWRLRSAIFSSGGLNAYLVSAGAMLFGAMPVQAMSVYSGSDYGNNLEVNLTTTISYTGLWRVSDPSATLKPAEDGDANFQHGLVGNLFSAVPVLDIRDGDYGAHFSGQFYINLPYLGTNQNDLSPYSSAIYTDKQTDFASGTRNVNGENAQLLDAFVFGQHTFDDGQSVQVKVGRSVLFWGQSLFFPTDGIAGGQAPINLISAQNLINPQAQQVFMPVGQAILTYEPRSGTTIQGYYQFEWEPNYYQGEGAYFSFANIYDRGASYLTLANLGSATVGLTRTKNVNPPAQNGQFGLSLQQEVGTWDLGIYGERFDAKAPLVGIAPTGGAAPIAGAVASALSAGTYTLIYPRDIWLQGVSFSTNLGAANVAGEFSVREHQPLVTNASAIAYVIAPGQNATNNPGYPVGNVWDAQLSGIYVSPPVPLDPGGVAIAGEVVLNHLINVTANRADLRTDGQATAGAFDVAITPTYNDVLPSLQITLPVSLTYDYLGRSEMDPTIYHGVGLFTAGVAATYKVNWSASLSYQDYLGKPNTVYNPLADRSFIALNLQRTF